MSKLQDIATKTLETAKKLGAQDARVSIGRSQELNIDWRKEKIENMSCSGSTGLSFSLFVDGKFGSFSTSDLRDESIQSFLKKSIDMTRLLEEDPARKLPDPEFYQNRADIDLDLYDQKIADMTPAQAIEKCKELEASSLKHSELNLIDVNTQVGTSVYESYMVASNGFQGSRKGTMITNGTDLILQDGERKPSSGIYNNARHIDDLRTIDDIVDEAVKYALLKIGPKKLPSKNRTLIFDRRISPYMVSKFISPLNGMSLVLKKSYFLDKIGETFASKLLNLYEDPFIKRGMDSRLYDNEGISTKKRYLFEDGVLKEYLLNVYSANKLGLKPNSGSITNLVLAPGNRSAQEMIADVKDGIYVIGIMGGNMDEVRGDFSHGIVGVAIEDGKLTTPVSEMNITGNHTDLWKRLVEVGNDPRTDTSSMIPSLRFDDVSVSGA